MAAIGRRALFALPLAVPAILAAKPRPAFADWELVARFKPFIASGPFTFCIHAGTVDEISAVRGGGGRDGLIAMVAAHPDAPGEA